MFKLIIEDDEGHTTVVPLVKDEITIGRKEGNTIRLTERNVSRHHARLLRSNGSFFIEDLDSYNGVKVNGDRITSRTTIREGDLVEIGDYHLALQKAAEAEAGGPPPVPGTAPPALPGGQPTQSDGATAILRLPVDKQESADAARARSIPQQQVGHLVVASTELAGQRFALQRTEMTIGRTEDNDIVVAHRSVSAQHAKIVFDNGTYRVIDMDSANGVLVNGEEYARVDLRNGDVIELGHVKLRFVPPGEPLPEALPDTSPQPQAQAAPAQETAVADFAPAAPRSGRGKLVGLGIGGALVVAAVAAILWPRGEPTPADQATDVAPAPPAATAAKPTANQEAARLYKEGLEKFRQGDYTAARVNLQAAQQTDPQYPGVETMLAQVRQAEKEAQLLSQARQAMDRQQWDDAWSLLEQISNDGPFKAEVGPLQDEVRKKVITFHLNKARLAMKSRDLLAVAENHIQKVESVDPGNRVAGNLRKQVAKLRASKTPRVASARPRAAPQAARAPRPGRQNAWKQVGVTRQELLRLRQQNPRKAIRLLQRVLEINPRDCDALSQLGACYALANEGVKGYEHYKRFVRLCPRHTLAPQARRIIRQFEEAKRRVQ